MDSEIFNFSKNFCDAIKKCKHPLVGLKHVVVIKTESTEPFVCCMCDKKGNCHNIMYHVISVPHRLKYLKKHFPGVRSILASRSLESKQDLVLELCHKIESHLGRKPVMFVNSIKERPKITYNKPPTKLTKDLFLTIHKIQDRNPKPSSPRKRKNRERSPIGANHPKRSRDRIPDERCLKITTEQLRNR